MSDESLIENADAIIEKFGGIRPMAAKLEVPVTTVQGWKKRNAIPVHRRDLIIKCAADHGIDVGALLDESAAPQAAPAPRTRTDDMIFNAQQQSVNTGMWTAIIVLGGLLIGGALLFGPHVKSSLDQSGTIAQLENKIATLEAQQQVAAKPAEEKMVSEGVQQDLNLLKSQAQNLQTKLTDLQTEAKTMGADLQAKIGAVAQTMSSESLSGVMLKLQAWSADPNTAPIVAQVTDKLASLMASARTEEQLQAALQAAQQVPDALGETLRGVPPENLRAAASLIAFNQFRAALERDNASFEKDLQLLKGLVAKDDPGLADAIDKLAPKAADGVLTNEGLSAAFRSMAGDIVVASLAGEDVQIKDKISAQIHALVQVEKDGAPVTGTDTQRRVQSAQNMIDQGDIPAAIVSLQGLEGAARLAAQPWIDQAQFSLLAGQIRDTVQNVIGTMPSTLPPGVGGGANVPNSAVNKPMIAPVAP